MDDSLGGISGKISDNSFDGGDPFQMRLSINGGYPKSSTFQSFQEDFHQQKGSINWGTPFMEPKKSCEKNETSPGASSISGAVRWHSSR